MEPMIPKAVSGVIRELELRLVAPPRATWRKPLVRWRVSLDIAGQPHMFESLTGRKGAFRFERPGFNVGDYVRLLLSSHGAIVDVLSLKELERVGEI